MSRPAHLRPWRLMPSAACAFAALASAQPPATPAAPAAPTAAAAITESAPSPAKRPDPLDVRSPLPPLDLPSAFTHYRRDSALQPQGWKDANDTVARIGGWRAYAREAAEPASASDRMPLSVSDRTPVSASESTPASAHAPVPASAPAQAPKQTDHPAHAHPRSTP